MHPKGDLRVAHIGNLSNASYTNVKFLRQTGIVADLFISYKSMDQYGSPVIRASSDPRSEDALEDFPEFVKLWEARPLIALPFRLCKLASVLRTYDIINAYTESPIFVQFVRKPYIAFATGSDLREMAVGSSGRARDRANIIYWLKGKLLRRAYRKASACLFTDLDSRTLSAIAEIGIKNASFIPYIVDADMYRPLDVTCLKSKRGAEFIVFSAARQDWYMNGSNLLISAFSEFVKKCCRNSLLILMRSGEDVDRSIELVRELEMNENVVFLNDMSKQELIEYYNLADVVAGYFKSDKWGVPHFPLTIHEAMACGRPVLTYFEADNCRRFFSEVPPLIYAGNEREICEKLIDLHDQKRQGLLDRYSWLSRKWIVEHNHWQKVTEIFVRTYRSVTVGEAGE